MTNQDAVEALKALAHPVRLKIVQALAGVERNVGEIDAVAEIGQPSLSQQLAVLRAAGLVQTRREAKQVFYRLDEQRIEAIGGTIGSLLPDAGRAAHEEIVRNTPVIGAARFARLG